MDGENHVIFVFDKISGKLEKQEEGLSKDILKIKESKKDILSKIDKLENKTWAINEILLDNSEELRKKIKEKDKKDNSNVIENIYADKKPKGKFKFLSEIINNDISMTEVKLKEARENFKNVLEEAKTDKKGCFFLKIDKNANDKKEDELRVILAREKKEELETKIKELKEQLQLFTDGQENDKDDNKKLREQLKTVDGIIAEKEEKLRNIFLIKLELKTQKDKIIENVVNKYKSNKNLKSNSERLNFIFSEINNYIKEKISGNF